VQPIRQITEDSGATVDIDDDGTVKVFGQNQSARDAAVDMIMAITAEAEVGAIYTGKVARIVDFRRVHHNPAREGWLAAYFSNCQ
jgi:polyribonucleotide nucleotidyltransferase